jgi:alkanesulfonate monooxygenase SsuD/methylene tetrahydromethanopterin reductase-like flavin-dependent oxidoreductase (luciferase family)
LHSKAHGIGYARSSRIPIGTAEDVAGQLAELRDPGAGHLLCQMSLGYLDHERIKRSRHRLGETLIAAFS